MTVSDGKKPRARGESVENAVPYRSSFILLYERTAFPPLSHNVRLSVRTRRKTGENVYATHCNFSVVESIARPLISCSSSRIRSSSSRACLASLVRASRIVALRSNPASSARLRSTWNSRNAMTAVRPSLCCKIPMTCLVGVVVLTFCKRSDTHASYMVHVLVVQHFQFRKLDRASL